LWHRSFSVSPSSPLRRSRRFKLMFERYPEESRQALFLARAAALSEDAAAIEREHLLAGALEVWLPATSSREPIFSQLGLAPRFADGFVAGDIPFSKHVLRLLNTAMVRADQFGHYRIRPEHLLVALVEESGLDRLLREVGIVRKRLIESATQAALLDDSVIPSQTE
jgi:ATP-dependent Clp protease ATP-binding subunit ClpA